MAAIKKAVFRNGEDNWMPNKRELIRLTIVYFYNKMQYVINNYIYNEWLKSVQMILLLEEKRKDIHIKLWVISRWYKH